MTRCALVPARWLACIVVIFVLPSSLRADLILAPTASVTTYDFSQFSVPFQFSNGPLEIAPNGSPSVLWTTAPSPGIGLSGSVIGNGTYGLGANGSWNSARNGYVGLNSVAGSMTFTFNGYSVREVGGFVNYVPGASSFTIEALSSSGATLESYNVSSLAPISTPASFNAGAFRGIARLQDDIAAFRISGGNPVLDDFSFLRGNGDITAVPEPSSMALAAIALSACGIRVLSKRKRNSIGSVSIAG
jgi:hypothetical protein